MKQQSILSFIESNGLFFSIPDDLIFIFLCFFLCYYRKNDHEDLGIAINYELISQKLNLSITYSRKLASHFQQLLSKISSSFIINILKEANEKIFSQEIAQLLYKKTPDGKHLLPCYMVTKSILNHMILHELNLTLIIKHPPDQEPTILTYKGNKQKNDFISNQDKIPDFNEEGSLIITGIMETDSPRNLSKNLNRIQMLGIKNVILMNAAAHPQYIGLDHNYKDKNPFSSVLNSLIIPSGAVREKIALSAEEFKVMRNMAFSYGCALNNQKTFLIKHIFCDTLNVNPLICRKAEVFKKTPPPTGQLLNRSCTPLKS